ncbi:hypothetical protein V5O48_010331 [Marasmius crinis-equi]|uniref:F-box domain-containing protein n=1 Tax=Marasmius crinis-equi TaxID=585013 RepID=A0ABR3F937_9AGAR
MTVTVQCPHPRRPLSSLASSVPPPLLSLPTELVLSILELCIERSRQNTLAVVCKAVSRFVDAILYRTVILDSRETIYLFHQTTLSKPPSFFANHVKCLNLSYNPPSNSVQFHRLQDIITSCSGMRSLVLPPGYEQRGIQATLHALRSDELADIVIHSLEGPQATKTDSIASRTHLHFPALPVTHLRVCEPGNVFIAPCSLLSTFGSLPRLSHLQLSRRINANAYNDQVFIDDVVRILRTRPELKMLVVCVFPQRWTPLAQSDAVAESNIWNMLREISEQDCRLSVRGGKNTKWKAGYDGVGEISSKFWVSPKCS